MKNKKLTFGLMASGSLLLAACGSDLNRVVPTEGSDGDNSGNSGSGAMEVVFDTGSTAKQKWAYFDIDTGDFVEEVGAWDIALKRDKGFLLKDGATVALAEAQTDYYDENGKALASAFINADAQFELDTFYATTEADEYAATFETSAFQDHWYTYQGPPTHAITANVDKYFIVSAGDGSYAKVRAFNVTPEYLATFEFYVQKNGEPGFSDTPVSVDVSLKTPGQTCFDFANADIIGCSDAGWDVKFDIASRKYTIRTNGGVSGEGAAKALGPVAVDEYAAGTAQGIAYASTADYVASALTESNPWVYGADPSQPHVLLPNYRVYAIDFGDDREPVKVQFINYYDAEGSSGQITMRYMSLADDGK